MQEAKKKSSSVATSASDKGSLIACENGEKLTDFVTCPQEGSDPSHSGSYTHCQGKHNNKYHFFQCFEYEFTTSTRKATVEEAKRSLIDCEYLNQCEAVYFAPAREKHPMTLVQRAYCPVTLEAVVKSFIRTPHQLPFTKRTQIAHQTAIALSALHAARITHQAIKSHNIFLTREDDVRVSNYGFSVIRTECHTISQGEGTISEVGGNLAYAAPEILDIKSDFQAPSDVYAYGVILWELVTLEPPGSTRGKDSKEIRISLLREAGDESKRVHALYDRVKKLNEDKFPPLWREIMEGCWKFNPKERLTMAQIVDMWAKGDSTKKDKMDVKEDKKEK